MTHRCFSPVLILLWLVLPGCANTAAPPTKPEQSARLFQLNDEQWLDLSDVKEILFLRGDPPAVASGTADPFAIAIYHRGATDNPFRFTFTDETEAYTSWKRLTSQLGGSLHDDDWKPTAASKPVTVQPAAPPPAPQPLFPNGASTNFSIFREDLAQLTACRDANLITPDEYQRGHDRKVADFVASAGNGSGYQSLFGHMHEELKELEAFRGDHLLSDDEINNMHKAIIARYIPPPE